MLHKFRESALVDEKFGAFDDYLKSTKKDMETHGISTNSSSKNETILERGGRLLKKLNPF